MPNTKSAKKAMRQSLKRYKANKAVKSQVKTFIKKALKDPSFLPKAVSVLHKALKKGVLKKNNVNRKISRLMIKINKLHSKEKQTT